jgi:hypothetical protein
MGKSARLLAALYLGFALSYFADLYFTSWRFYVIVIPFYFLLGIHDMSKEIDNEDKE